MEQWSDLRIARSYFEGLGQRISALQGATAAQSVLSRVCLRFSA